MLHFMSKGQRMETHDIENWSLEERERDKRYRIVQDKIKYSMSELKQGLNLLLQSSVSYGQI